MITKDIVGFGQSVCNGPKDPKWFQCFLEPELNFKPFVFVSTAEAPAVKSWCYPSVISFPEQRTASGASQSQV